MSKITEFIRNYGLIICVALSLFILSSCNATTGTQEILRIGTALLNTQSAQSGNVATSSEVTSAFKQALNIGVGEVVTRLGQNDGFNADRNIHIPLPQSLANVQKVLGKVGMSSMLDDLELRLNRAAETATPHVKELFVDAISQMTFTDIWNIYNGGQDSATRYFKSKMSTPLAGKMTPIVNSAIAQTGVVQSYDNVMAQYQSIPFVPNVKADLTNYVVGQGIEGIFYYLAKEEAAIRQDPVRQTTALLRKVFGK